MDQGKDSPWPGTVLGIAALIALPFVLLAWLLVETMLDHAARYEQMDKVLLAFDAGLKVIQPLETMRDTAPTALYLEAPELAARHAAAHEEAERNLAAFVASVRAMDSAPLQDTTDRLLKSWKDVVVEANDTSNTTLPFDNVERFNDSIYSTMSSLLFVSGLSAGRTVDANELLILLVDTLRKARRELGLVRAIAVYTSLRDGFLSSADAGYLDDAWSTLDSLDLQLVAQQTSLKTRLGNEAVFNADLAPLREYLRSSEDELILSPRVSLEWRNAWDDGEVAMNSLRGAGDDLLRSAKQIVAADRRQQTLQDTASAIGLVLLYIVVTTLGVYFYRTRYAVVHAQAENRARGLFLARMSHEIRTPLNGVIGLSELLAETEPTARQREYIELISSAGKSLVSLVNDILDHAKIEAGKLEIERIPVEIRVLVNESVQVFGLRAGQNRTLIFCHCDKDVPVRVLGDPIRIRQVLINLIGNAVKFTEEGRVEVSVTKTTGNDGAQRLRIEVRDTGIGLSAQEQQGLFNLFAQASSEVTRRFGGTGLGLSISRELIQLMGGSIGVYSGVGPGAVFWFELPLTAVQASETAPVRDEIPTTPVLLVDEDGHLSRAIEALPPRVAERIALAVNEFDAQRVLDLHPEIRFIVINSTRRPDHAHLLAQHLRAFNNHLFIRLLVAVGTEGTTKARAPGTPLADIDEVVARSVFSPVQLLNLLTPGTPESLAAARTPTAPVQAVLPTGLRVMVAEDNPVNQMVTRGLLRRLGIDADIVGDGAKALALYQSAQGRFDMILMDLDMPVMDGNSATRAIRDVEVAKGWTRCPILALSAHAMPEYGAMARAAGMDGQLIKPVTLATLSDALSRHYRRGPTTEPSVSQKIQSVTTSATETSAPVARGDDWVI